MKQLIGRAITFLSRFRSAFGILSGPLIFLTIYLLLFFFFRGRVSQNPEDFINNVKLFYSQFGYPVVFLGAFFEGLFPVGMYIPGSTVVLLGAVLSKTGVIAFPLVIILGIIGFVLAYTTNYFLGKYGIYHVLSFLGLEKEINSVKLKLEKNQTKTIFLGLISPGPGAFLSTSAGVLKIPFKKFIFLVIISQSFWSLLWGSIAYIFGMPLVELFLKNLFIIIGFIVIVWIFKSIRKKS